MSFSPVLSKVLLFFCLMLRMLFLSNITTLLCSSKDTQIICQLHISHIINTDKPQVRIYNYSASKYICVIRFWYIPTVCIFDLKLESKAYSFILNFTSNTPWYFLDFALNFRQETIIMIKLNKDRHGAQPLRIDTGGWISHPQMTPIALTL